MKRTFNFLGNMRLDIPHLRMVESAITDEFDSLVGQLISGGNSHIVRGLTISPAGIGGLASALELELAGAVVSHTNASEPGALLYFEPTEAAQVLSSSNSKVLGSFQASSTNYVGIDLVREIDSTTADTVKFIDATSNTEISRNVPLGRVLKYRIHISTNGFASSTNVLPVAKIVTNASNRVTSIADARPMMFGLYNGGDLVNANFKHTWVNRDNQISTTTVATSDPFSIGDKNLTSMKDWMDGVMTRLWEVGGGEAWYSNTSDRDIKVAYGANIIGATGQNFEWNLASMKYIKYDAQTVNFTPGAELGQAGPTADIVSDIDDGTVGVLTVTNVIGTFVNNIAITDTSGGAAVADGTVVTTSQNLRWRGIKILFSNSTASYNTVTDNIVGVTFPDDYVLYVDVDRETEGAAIVATAVPRDELGTATTPGSRFILAWRKGDDVFIRDHSYEVGRSYSVATTVAFGDLRVYDNDNEVFNPSTPEGITTKSLNVSGGVPSLATAGGNLGLTSATKGVDGHWLPLTLSKDLGSNPLPWNDVFLNQAIVKSKVYVQNTLNSIASGTAPFLLENLTSVMDGYLMYFETGISGAAPAAPWKMKTVSALGTDGIEIDMIGFLVVSGNILATNLTVTGDTELQGNLDSGPITATSGTFTGIVTGQALQLTADDNIEWTGGAKIHQTKRILAQLDKYRSSALGTEVAFDIATSDGGVGLVPDSLSMQKYFVLPPIPGSCEVRRFEVYGYVEATGAATETVQFKLFKVTNDGVISAAVSSYEVAVGGAATLGRKYFGVAYTGMTYAATNASGSLGLITLNAGPAASTTQMDPASSASGSGDNNFLLGLFCTNDGNDTIFVQSIEVVYESTLLSDM